MLEYMFRPILEANQEFTKRFFCPLPTLPLLGNHLVTTQLTGPGEDSPSV